MRLALEAVHIVARRVNTMPPSDWKCDCKTPHAARCDFMIRVHARCQAMQRLEDTRLTCAGSAERIKAGMHGLACCWLVLCSCREATLQQLLHPGHVT
jgi:hypothetical protein